MGIYLSTPSSHVDVEDGGCKGVTYGVAEMQGWRKNMEDSHITLVDLNGDKDDEKPVMSLFGVFDGHGGKEVAKFVRLKYPEVFVGLKEFQEDNFEEALRVSFHKIDQLLEDKQYDGLLNELKNLPNPSDVLDGGRKVPPPKTPLEMLHGDGEDDDDESFSNLPLSTKNPTKFSNFDGTTKENEKNTISTSEAVSLIRSILNSRQAGAIQLAQATTGGNKDNEVQDVILPKDDGDEDENSSEVYKASTVTGSGMVCNLKDHRVMAGCTAVVAFLVGDKLIVANAGDSRGVLCRKGGISHQLSYDHKPQQDTELSRIEASGGFVNNVGRINGNLNLSRSLGDLKYKQNPNISAAAQMITAEPDITVTEIEPTDRFFVLACDGIWDCMTCQEACDFVSERLDAGVSVKDIVSQMCLHCLADDPRTTAGIGGDNMTAMVVLLNDNKPLTEAC